MIFSKIGNLLPSCLRFQLFSFIISYVLRSLLSLFWLYLTPLLKVFLRKCTGLCELQRICYKTEKGAQRSLEVEKCIIQSRREAIKVIRNKLHGVAKNGRFNSKYTRELVQLIEQSVETICTEKDIKPSIHPEFVTAMRICFLQIYGYKNLQREVNHLRSLPVDIHNVNHENKLVKLWNILNPDCPLKSKISAQWIEIGFLSEDPVANFKNVGLLGLENILYFAIHHSETAYHIISDAKTAINGSKFGSIGIDLTYIAINLLNNGRLKTHFFNSHFGTNCLEDFHKVYCYLYCTFHKLLVEDKPKDDVELSYTKEKFIHHLNRELERNDVILKWIPLIER